MKVKSCIKLLRPIQWIKNLIIFAPLFFYGSLFDETLFLQCCIIFVSFCLMSSAVYCFNDIHDVISDRLHPMKCHRPIAAGLVSRIEAYGMMTMCVMLALGGLFITVEWEKLLIVISLYMLLNIAYCIYLKKIAVIDVTCISIGFVLRMLAGGIATNIIVSQWLLLMTYLLALFFALIKRYDDMMIAEKTGDLAQVSMSGYNHTFVAVSLSVSSSIMLVSYIMYTMSEEVTNRLGTHYVLLTSIWVLIAVLRFLQVTMVYNRSVSLTSMVLSDRFIWFCFAGWIVTFFFIIYR